MDEDSEDGRLRQEPGPPLSVGRAAKLRLLFRRSGVSLDSQLARDAMTLAEVGRWDLVEQVIQPLEETVVWRELHGRIFNPPPELTDGLFLATLLSEDEERPIHLPVRYASRSFFIGGSPDSGKTTLGKLLLAGTAAQGIGAIVPDFRSDWHSLALRVPRAFLVPWHELRFNPFEPPPGVPLRKWLHIVAGRLTFDLGLEKASFSYVVNLFSRLADLAEEHDVVPTLLDFREILRRETPRPRSSTEGYWERTKARVHTLIELGGEETFSVQRGYPLLEEAESGRTVVLDFRTERMLSEFLTSVLLFKAYLRRLSSPDPLSNAPVIFALDEARSIIQAHNPENGVVDLDLLWSRARGLGLSLLVCEQLPSQASPALVTACRTRFAMCTNPPENFFVARRLLGLNAEQAEEIPRLKPGESIVQLPSEVWPHPFKMRVPQPQG